MSTRGPRLAPLAVLAAALAGCAGPEALLDARGPSAANTATLWWIMFAMGAAVYVVVMVLIGLAFWRGRRRDIDDPALKVRDEDTSPAVRRLVIFGGIVGPALVLLVLNLVSVPMGQAVGDRGASAEGVEGYAEEDVVVNVTAEVFWWRVEYPGRDVITANEIHIPVGEEVRIRLTSEDVIHSFWVPKLAGKIDATPGHTTELVLEADEPGRYRGRCTEYCGIAHAQMIIHVVAQERDEFDTWVEQQQQPQPQPATERIEEGRQVFFGSSCVYCHTVDGHGPPNQIGPDLTHLASRETIGAGIMPNTRGNLAGWIVDPQAQKPGNLMPGTQIAGDELDALLDYLESLE
ncbi:cytochrome c oxidase subunit II [Egicoccus halophilus]|uniref:cytochrome-c oxidase n=1 Tax=Egicoccus halophilus TaxID=1670830 RepID=A0A8J3AAI6_9ACTN|nr:cytochrome c oxidase subunit II [Egicoccus halophilus]GGI03031.1 cytochrome c oxidase subunit II [Egicoccus halophilus]